jgi:F-type H+-transporting ATPase subunit a
VVTERVLAFPHIPVGEHVTAKVAGLTLDLDTIWSTGIACAIVLALGFYVRRRVTASTPNKAQLFWEFLIGVTGEQVENSLGRRYRHVVPIAVTLFVLILAANWVELLPGFYHATDYLPSPSADVNTVYALAACVLVMTTASGIRAKGSAGYIKSFFGEPRFLAPIRILETFVTNPISLALRLFGNLFAGGIMIALLLAIPWYGALFSVPVTVAWKLFDMFIGLLQAFIFALLTVLYWQFAVEEAH